MFLLISWLIVLHSLLSSSTFFQLTLFEKTKMSARPLLSSPVPFKEGVTPRWTDLSYLWHPALSWALWKTIHGLPRTPDPNWAVLKESFFLFFVFLILRGFGVTAPRTVAAPLKGVVEDTQWSWSSLLNARVEPKVLSWLFRGGGVVFIYMNVMPLLLLCLMSVVVAVEVAAFVVKVWCVELPTLSVGICSVLVHIS